MVGKGNASMQTAVGDPLKGNWDRTHPRINIGRRHGVDLILRGEQQTGSIAGVALLTECDWG